MAPFSSGVEPSGAAGAVQSSCTVWAHTCNDEKKKVRMRDEKRFMFV